MPTYEAEATLAQLETEFHRLADNWRAEFLKTRALRIQFRGRSSSRRGSRGTRTSPCSDVTTGRGFPDQLRRQAICNDRLTPTRAAR